MHPLPKKIILWQAVVSLMSSLLLLAVFDRGVAIAGAFGGLIAVALTFYVGRRAFAKGRVRSAEEMMAAMFRAEMVKIFLAAFLFALAAIYFAANFAAVVIVYLLATLVFFVALLWRH